jgi:hypothetical protein
MKEVVSGRGGAELRARGVRRARTTAFHGISDRGRPAAGHKC